METPEDEIPLEREFKAKNSGGGHLSARYVQPRLESLQMLFSNKAAQYVAADVINGGLT